MEYEEGCYHVMNRGGVRQKIFQDEDCSEAHQRFGIQIMCYCLMSNHYYLLLKTPEVNLGRAMRYINGVYTQRHHRLKQTDGSLFQGCYNAL